MTLVAYTGTSTATTRPMGTPPSLMALATDDHDTSISTSYEDSWLLSLPPQPDGILPEGVLLSELVRSDAPVWEGPQP